MNAAEQTKSDDTWGDWDNEEYTGSLADTKVFTPSTVQNQTLSHAEQLSAPPGLEQQILNPPSQLNDDLVQQYSTNTVSNTPSAVSVGNNNSNQVQYSDLHVQSSTNASHLRPAIDIPLNSSSLSAEQSQYFNSLSSQPVSAVQYSSPYACKCMFYRFIIRYHSIQFRLISFHNCFNNNNVPLYDVPLFCFSQLFQINRTSTTLIK